MLPGVEEVKGIRGDAFHGSGHGRPCSVMRQPRLVWSRAVGITREILSESGFAAG